MFNNPLRKRQYIGSLIGIIIGVATYVILPMKASEDFLSLGPMNTGHEDLSCNACHTDAKGNLMQQLTTNMQYAVGMRKESVPFGTQDIDNKKCLACHDRPNDRHPTHRFLETKFKDAIKKINATECETCHTEHHGVRVVLDDATFCVNCHSDLKVIDDPIDVPHEELIANKQWTTCLQCHDFHGNHVYKTATKIKDTLSLDAISAYLEGGEDPFTSKKKYYPTSEEEWIKQNEKKTK